MGKLFTNFILALTIVSSCVFFFVQGRKSLVFYGDTLGYYLYLPTIFIYENSGEPEILPRNKGIDQGIHNYIADMNMQLAKSPKGYTVNQYTYGTAFFELLFFYCCAFF